MATIKKNMVIEEYYNATECLFSTLPIAMQRVEMLKEKLIECDETAGEVRGINYSQERIKTSEISKSTELIALHNLKEKGQILEQITEEQELINKYTGCLRSLSSIDREIVEYRCFDRQPWDEISLKVKYSKKQCQNRLKESMAAMTVLLYGSRVLIRYKSIDSL